ncbi:MAG: JAB domain-containing protein [Bacillota bacterium]
MAPRRKSSGAAAGGTPAKRVDIVSLRVVRESTILYGNRRISSPEDAADLLRGFLEDADREKFCLACLNTKNEPTCIATVGVGTLGSSLVHPRELFKVAVITNAASVIIFHNHRRKNMLTHDFSSDILGVA